MPAPSALPSAPTHLLYLHGFRSSPGSFKAQRMAAWVASHRPQLHWWCPQLPPSPAAAIALLRAGTTGWPADTSAVVGSSLGGFYATVMAEATGWRAVVLNPAVDPARDLAAHIGEQTAWHDPAEHFYFAPTFIDELRAMHPPALTRLDRCAAVIAEGDELLDWHEMSDRYVGAHIRRIEGSDHALSDFDAHLPFVLDFLNLCD